MKLKRMFACLFIVAAFPLLASHSGNSFVNSVPFASVAFAGHVTTGGEWCDCRTAAFCICDEGEMPGGGAHSTNSNPNAGSFNQGASPVGADSTRGLDIGSSAMMLALAVLVWARFLRA